MHDGLQSLQLLELPCVIDNVLVQSEQEITRYGLNFNELFRDWEDGLFFKFKGLSFDLRQLAVAFGTLWL